MNTDIGKNIRKFRTDLGITQRELGTLCGIAEPTIRRYELGKLNPKYETIKKIAKELKVTPEQIIYGHDQVIIFSDLTDEQCLESTIELVAIELDVSKEYLREVILNHGEKNSELYSVASRVAYLLTTPRNQMLLAFDQMNEKGQEKAATMILDLAKIPEYQKKKDE